MESPPTPVGPYLILMLPGMASRFTQIIVGVADLKFSDAPESILITYALGSCLGVTCYDPIKRVGALLHALLPDSSTHGRASPPPAMFLETGIRELQAGMRALRSNPDDREYKVFGGARLLAGTDFLGIGTRNIAMMRKLALVDKLRIKTWDVGGQVNRTIQFYLDNGDVGVRMPNRPDTCV